MNIKNLELNQIIRIQNSYAKELKQLEKLLKRLECLVIQHSRQLNIDNSFATAPILKQSKILLNSLGRSENQIINSLVKLLR
jgi:hypothetical protein